MQHHHQPIVIGDDNDDLPEGGDWRQQEHNALRREIAQLRRENAQLRQENAQLRQENARLDTEHARLPDRYEAHLDCATQLRELQQRVDSALDALTGRHPREASVPLPSSREWSREASESVRGRRRQRSEGEDFFEPDARPRNAAEFAPGNDLMASGARGGGMYDPNDFNDVDPEDFFDHN